MVPFVITTYSGNVAYYLDLVAQFFSIQSVFHMSLLCRFVPVGYRVAHLKPIDIEAS